MFNKKNLKILFSSILGLAIFALVSYGLFMGVYHYTSQPEFCAKCHYVKPYVVSWEESPHKGINCLQCHEPAGPLGKLHSKSRGLNYYLMDKTENHTSVLINASYVNERNCFACHIGEYQEHLHAAKINRKALDHIKSIKNDEACISCHRGVGHETDINIENKIK